MWPEELLAKKPELRGKTLYEVLYATPVVQIPGIRTGGRSAER
ncbi:MAG: hypothetical protein ACLRP3_04800 [Escherichia sp.]